MNVHRFIKSSRNRVRISPSRFWLVVFCVNICPVGNKKFDDFSVPIEYNTMRRRTSIVLALSIDIGPLFDTTFYRLDIVFPNSIK